MSTTGNDPHFDFALGFYMFPAGVVDVDATGQRVDVHPDGCLSGQECPDCGFCMSQTDDGGYLCHDCGTFIDFDGKIWRDGEYPPGVEDELEAQA